MNSDEVKRLRELEAAATPAPWTVKTYQDESGEWNPAPSWHVWDEDNLFLTFELRNHAPALLSAVEERDRLREENAEWSKANDSFGKALQEAREENTTLRRTIDGFLPMPGPATSSELAIAEDRDLRRLLATERAESERLRGMVRRLREAAQERLRGGHNDTCSHLLAGHYECSCGQSQLTELLEEQNT